MCDRSGLSIAELVRANETVLAGEASIDDRLDRLTAVMFDCIDRGMRTDGELPGGLHVKRRPRSRYTPPPWEAVPQGGALAPYRI